MAKPWVSADTNGNHGPKKIIRWFFKKLPIKATFFLIRKKSNPTGFPTSSSPALATYAAAEPCSRKVATLVGSPGAVFDGFKPLVCWRFLMVFSVFNGFQVILLVVLSAFLTKQVPLWDVPLLDVHKGT